VSPSLPANTTFWTEVGLSTNTSASRLVEAITDSQTADSSLGTRFTGAAPALSPAVTNIGVSSMTLTWDNNTNPSPTVYIIERSTDNALYTQIATNSFSGTQTFTDTNLMAQQTYFYRVKPENGDGVIVPAIGISSATTLAVPPPSVNSIAPVSAQNLGTLSFAVKGHDFQPGATLIFKRSPTLFISPATVTVQGTDTITGSVNITGAFATAWDIEVTNPNGKISVGTGKGIFNVTNASSMGAITIQTYVASTPLSFTTTDSQTFITMGANAMNNGRLYISVDPLNSPLLIDPSLLAAANAALSGLTLIPGSLREMEAFDSNGRYSSGFNSMVTLAINYLDANNDGILDNIIIQASTLKMMTLNESTRLWEPVPSAKLDTGTKQVQAIVNHFSVYALFGSPAASNLSQTRITPNPWKPGSGGKFDSALVTISNLTDTGTVRIYTLNASLVKEAPYSSGQAGVLTWDGKNNKGENIASGVYLLHIESSTGEKKILKLGVER
jgi:hypothetical protein